MRKKHKKAFTLLEVISCLVLLSTLIAVSSISGVRMISTYKEKLTCYQIEERISFIHKFASVIHSSGQIDFTNEKGGLIIAVSFYSAIELPITPVEKYENFKIQENTTIFFTPEGLPASSVINIIKPSNSQFLLKINL